MHNMNPFDFVPLSAVGPKEIPGDVLEGKRFEGYITYSLKTLTPLHINGKTTKSGKHFDRKSFYENYGHKVIPGASVRGMLYSFIEALTGSDLSIYTRGDEKGSSGVPAYGKNFDPRNAQKCRHVGFLMTSKEDTLKAKGKSVTYNHLGKNKTRKIFERNETLASRFGLHKVEDVARFLFGYVDEDKPDEDSARAGRLIFEDILLPDNAKMKLCKAWDLDSDAIMGGPNPRANIAWYFTPGESRVRTTDRGFKVWEVLADKIRGRKFYFHHHPADCHEEYRKWKQWMQLVEYDVESVPENTELQSGRIYFTDMPMPLLVILAYALNLEPNLAHKLGALKPFGCGSVQLSINGLFYRDMEQPLDDIEEQGLSGNVNANLFDMRAYRFLKKIMHFPTQKEKENYIFVYPPFNSRGANTEKKGFAVVERAGHSTPIPGNSEKPTMFFDHYQEKAKNFQAVMGGESYRHLL